jgi:beta-lactamase class A
MAHLSIKNLWNKKNPFVYISIGAVILFVVIISLHKGFSNQSESNSIGVNESKSDCPPQTISQYRENSFKYTRPLLLTDVGECANDLSDKLKDIQFLLNNFINEKKALGNIENASVYLSAFGQSISLNDEETYHPASLMKIPVLMTYLRAAEITPGLLEKKLFLSKSLNDRKINFPDEMIEPGKDYTIRELLYRTIVYSDNNADYLLYNNMQKDLFLSLFHDLGLPMPGENSYYICRASEISKFPRMLYNASYILSEDADYALSLLAKCRFKEGMVKGIPSDVLIAHKFGEFGIGDSYELHETGIIYYDNSPFLITVMTKGNNLKLLPGIISDISKTVFDKIKESKP